MSGMSEPTNFRRQGEFGVSNGIKLSQNYLFFFPSSDHLSAFTYSAINMLVVVLGNKPKIIMKFYCWQNVSANGNILNLTRGPYTCVPFDYLFMGFWGKRGGVKGEGSSSKYDYLLLLDWLLATTDGQPPQTYKSYFLVMEWLLVKKHCQTKTTSQHPFPFPRKYLRSPLSSRPPHSILICHGWSILSTSVPLPLCQLSCRHGPALSRKRFPP